MTEIQRGKILDELKWRGALNQLTDEDGLRKLTQEKAVSVYCGTDPTGDSLHVGHLIPFMILKRFQLMGHRPVIVIGGGTGSIGDPSGRNSERVLQTMDTIVTNKKKLTAQMENLFGTEDFRIVDNYDWLSKISMLDFLRDYGKLFSVNNMLNKEVVASRLETGISYTEFTYQILQSVDFLHLFKHEDVQLQIGGADQWGNITAGIDLIHRIEGPDARAYGLTNPLMLKADGTKFGKSAGGAVCLIRKRPRRMSSINSGSTRMMPMLKSSSSSSRSCHGMPLRNWLKRLKRIRKNAKHNGNWPVPLRSLFTAKKRWIKPKASVPPFSPVMSRT